MKKFYNFMAVALVAMLTLTLTSCNDDAIARELDGVWAGSVTTGSSWRNHSFQYVEIEFFKNPYRYAQGSGREYDYNNDDYDRYYTGGRTCYICDFTYEVNDNVISIYYEDGTKVRIYDYDLYNNTFTGEFRNGYNDRYIASFSFARLTKYRYEYGGYNVYRYYGGNYINSNDIPFEEEKDSTATAETK